MKIYSLLFAVLACLFAQGAAAKTVTFKTNINGSVKIVTGDKYAFYDITEEGVAIELGASEGVNLQPQPGYAITKVLDQNSSYVSNSSNFIYYWDLVDGGVITIYTEEREPRTLKIIANAEECYVSYDYHSYYADDQVDGAWYFPNVDDNAPINIYAKDGYAIEKVVDQNNVEQDLSGPKSFWKSGSSWNGDLVLTATTYKLDDRRTKSVTFKIDGNPEDVKIARNGYNDEVAESKEFTFKYMDSELPLSVTHSNYQMTIFKVMLNDEPVEKNSSNSYSVSPQDGDIITVQPESNVDVDIKFNYNPAEVKGIVSRIEVNGSKKDWDSEKITVKQGYRIYFDLNTTDYENISASINGTPIEFPTYGSYYEFVADDENGYTIDVTATVKQPYPVKIIAEDYDKVVVYNGTTYEHGDPIYLTQKETTLTVPLSNNYITIQPISNEYLVNLSATGSYYTSPYYPSQISIEGDDVVITVEVEELIRDKQLAVYLEEGVEWLSDYCYALLSNWKPTEYKAYLKEGYQVVKFGDFDNEISFTFYGPGWNSPQKYYNGELLEYFYSTNVEDGDVLKCYMSEPAKHSVTYEIEDGAGVNVYHDYITLIDNPSTHTVFDNTEIHIKPQADAQVKVEVNNTALTPNEEGYYAARITADSNVKVSVDSNTGIEDITDGNDAPVNVYNLQGIRVLRGASEAEIRALPAGVYVAGGKKIVIR